MPAGAHPVETGEGADPPGTASLDEWQADGRETESGAGSMTGEGVA